MTDLLDPGEDVDLTTCDCEPIDIPGTIQSHGLLFTLTEPDLIVRQCSENVTGTLGRTPDELIGAPLAHAVGDACAQAVVELAARPSDEELPMTPLVVIVDGGDGPRACQLALHRSGGLLVAELEPHSGGGVDPSAFVRDLSEAMVQMQRANGVRAVSQRAAEEVKRLTGYGRVMVHRFDEDGHGEVIAEVRDAGLEPFLGHHHPSTDLSRQARERCLRQTIRVIVDVDDAPSAIVPGENPLTGTPLHLGLATLRSASPIHLQCLRNMGVTATMTISLTRDGELWGMIACHHRSRMQVDAGVRATCRFIGGLLSFQCAREEESDLARQRDALRTIRADLLGLVRSSPTLAAGLRAGADLLLELGGADGVSVLLDGERVTIGDVPDAETEQRLVDELAGEDSVRVTDRLPGCLPELAQHTSLCGALALELPRGVGRHIVWYRRAWSQAVTGRSRPWREVHVEAAAELVRALAEHMVVAMREQLAHVALHDPLTGLPNRTLLMESLHQVLRARPHKDAVYAGLLFLDIDNFKLINDSLGHRAGDMLLQQIADRVSRTLRKGDVVGRLGGDEFVVVLPDVKHPSALEATADRIQARFAAPFELDGSECAVTASIGIAWADLREERSPSDVLRDADTAMYEAKRRGRGRSVRFQGALNDTRRRRVELERDLQGALGRRELLLEYQPLFDVTREVCGFEALVRWDSASLGRVGPAEFIPIAEETGLIEEIGEWVLQTALQRLAELRLEGATDVSMAVNLSARQLADVGLPARLHELLAARDLPPGLVTVEIAEGLLVGSGGLGEQTLARIRQLGVQVAIDDFGTGVSSLAHLRRLPVDTLKIDRSFIAELGRGEADREIVGGVIDLARRLGMHTVAEGVETEEQLRILRELRCDLVQGFLLARPLPADQLARVLAARAG